MAFPIVYALPESHLRWGEPYPGEGQKAFGMIVLLALVGGAFALIYFIVGTLMQYILRNRPVKRTVAIDFLLGLCLCGLLIYGGVTLRYEQQVAAIENRFEATRI